MTNLALPLPQKTIYFSLGMQMYMSEKVKKPILEAVKLFTSEDASQIHKMKAMKLLWDAYQGMKGLPEPTKENTWHPNSHRLIELRDYLRAHCFMPVVRTGLIDRVMNFIIILYDFDPPWRWVIDSIIQKALTMKWLPRGFQDTWKETYKWWKEPA